MYIENLNPLEAWKSLISNNFIQYDSLYIKTDLKNLTSEFESIYANEFSWHYNDSQRSFFTDKIVNDKYEFSYYNRIVNHFLINQLDIAIANLNKSPKKALVSTWDVKLDLAPNSGLIPCFLLLFLERRGNNLDFKVVFRRRDLIKRLIPNWFCFKKLQAETAAKLNLNIGLFHDFSLSSFMKNEDLSRANKVLDLYAKNK